MVQLRRLLPLLGSLLGPVSRPVSHLTNPKKLLINDCIKKVHNLS